MAEASTEAAVTSAPLEEKPTVTGDVDAVAPSASDPAATATIDGADAPTDVNGDSVPPVTSTAIESTTDTKDNDVTAPTDVVISTNGETGASKGKKEKRKSMGSTVPEHKNKKLNRKKSMPNLHLDVNPGEYWFIQMKGYPPWPAIICDEEMLPESLLGKRPVSAMRPDGTYREDFAEGGKNVRDRRYPVMFLGTNEFAWQVNTEIMPLEVDDIKRTVETGDSGKKTKALWEAYQIAAEQHDLNYFKEMLVEHEKRVIQEQRDFEEKQAKKDTEEVKKPKQKRKSETTIAEDTEMEDAGGDEDQKKSKKTNKRKIKEPETEGEAPKSTVKKLKITNKSASTEEEPASKAKKASKPKPKKEKAAKAEPDSTTEPAPRLEELMTPAERLEKKQKTILYLRHKLQKGFLSRDQAPKEDEMPAMAEHLTQLEGHPDLEPSIIRATKINKVLKGIMRLASIPREEQFSFKSRSEGLLAHWNKLLNIDGDSPAVAVAEPTSTNGVSHDEKATSDAKPSEEPASAAKSEEPKENGDVIMKDAPATSEAETEATPAAERAAVAA